MRTSNSESESAFFAFLLAFVLAFFLKAAFLGLAAFAAEGLAGLLACLPCFCTGLAGLAFGAGLAGELQACCVVCLIHQQDEYDQEQKQMRAVYKIDRAGRGCIGRLQDICKGGAWRALLCCDEVKKVKRTSLPSCSALCHRSPRPADPNAWYNACRLHHAIERCCHEPLCVRLSTVVAPGSDALP